MFVGVGQSLHKCYETLIYFQVFFSSRSVPMADAILLCCTDSLYDTLFYLHPSLNLTWKVIYWKICDFVFFFSFAYDS